MAGAALGSQIVGFQAGSATLTETVTAGQAIEERQNAPSACQPGEVLVDGLCRPRSALAPLSPAAVGSTAAPGPPVAAASAMRSAAASAALSIASNTNQASGFGQAVAQVPPPIYDQSFRIGSWAQGFGDYEHRTGSQSTFFNCCTDFAATGKSPPIPMTLDASSTTSSGGVVGGLDFTKRGLSGPYDGVVAGLLGGYIWNNITVNTSAISSNPNKVANGSNRTTANINGPSLGLYATYFNGPFSNEFLIKNDFLSLSENWSGILGFGNCPCGIFAPTGTSTNPNFGSGSTNLNQLTIDDNVNYKIHVYGWATLEPTAGLLYVNSTYSSSAAALGLSDGYIFRI